MEVLSYSIEQCYSRRLHQVPAGQVMAVDSVLRWVANAGRPLATNELSVAVAFEILSNSVASKNLQLLKKDTSLDILRDLDCGIGSLVKVVDGNVYPHHGSLRTHFEQFSKEKVSSSDNHFTLLCTCLDYIEIFAALSPEAEVEDQSLEGSKAKLLKYAVLYWPMHF